ncbi:MAG TPA: CehA/McbA family metallohydrolase [Gemmatimonadaceae bacterium]|nr:CehA/McbA family metallohydrolase [Gemmatimonadaceae bacterium]
MRSPIGSRQLAVSSTGWTAAAALAVAGTAFFIATGRAGPARYGQSDRVERHMLPAVSTGPLDPAYSPDGKWIAFAMRGDIWKIPAQGGQAVALTQGPHYYFEPAWSPDGTQLAVTMDVGGNLDIGVVSAEGGDVRRLTTDPHNDVEPAWAHDGSGIYFTSDRGGRFHLFRHNLSGGADSMVTDGFGDQFQPAVSPDGTQLAYVGSVRGFLGTGGIWVMPTAGGEPRLVHYEESEYRTKPAWTPDGNAFLLVSDEMGSNDVDVISASGGNPVRLTADDWNEFSPSPSPDGRRFAFVSDRTGPTVLYTVSAGGGPYASWRAVPIASRRPRVATGRVRITVLGPDGRVLPARIYLSAADGRSYAPDGAFQRVLSATETHYFAAMKPFTVEVPAGTTSVEAIHGFEYRPARASVTVPAGGERAVTLRLSRLENLPAQGWYSGDTHIHDLHQGRWGLSHQQFFDELVSEDIHVTNALIHMDGTRIMGRWSDLTGRPSSLSTRDYILQYGEEFRGSLGHIAMLGIGHYVLPFESGLPNTAYAQPVLDYTYVDSAVAQGGIAGYAHPYHDAVTTPASGASSLIPVDVALGRGQFYDVSSDYSDELASDAMYFRLLNAGFRLPATGGTDNFSDVWRDPPPGTDRTYVHVRGALTLANWFAGIRARHTYSSTAPLVRFTVNGKEMGDEVDLPADAPAAVRVRADARSIAPMARLDVIVNGRVVDSTTAGDSLHLAFDREVPVPEGGWVAVRVTGPVSRYVGDSYVFAQTTPVWVVRGGRRFTSPSDARFLAELVWDLWTRTDRTAAWRTPDERARFRAGVARARGIYERIADPVDTAPLLDPASAAMNERAPDEYRVRFETTSGNFVVDVPRAWSPHGADRLYNLVRHGFYDDTRISRVVPHFIAQFGLNGSPKVIAAWKHAAIPDDSVRQTNARGTVAFAMTGPNTRTTQVYINLVKNARLDAQGFSPVGRVVSGMDVVDALYSGYGERAGGGVRAGKQGPIEAEGNAWLDRNFPRLDGIIRATIEAN